MTQSDDDADAMFRNAEGLLDRGVELEAEAREWLRRSAQAGSLAALHRLVGLAVADGDYWQGQHLLNQVKADHPDVPAEQWVSVAPGVLGPGVSLDGDDVEDVPGAGTFTVISPQVERAAAALARVAPELMNVDEHGNVLEPGWMPEVGVAPGEEVYTPSYVSDVQVCAYGAMVGLDTEGVMFSAMGRTMVGILVGALAGDHIPAHITGNCPDLHFWPPSKTDV